MRYKYFLLMLVFPITAFGFELKSSAFKNNEFIPSKFSCDGEDLSVDLSWTNAPENTKSFAIICEDPDAPAGTWIHWIIFNIPKDITNLAQGLPKLRKLENQIYQGRNDFGEFGYGGPCPPPNKVHRYFFKIYALDILIENPEKIITKSDLISAISSHIIAEAELVGLYKR